MIEMYSYPKAAARRLLARVGYKLPVDITRLVKDHGITLIGREVERSVTGALVVDSSHATMLVNRAFEASQQRFSLAHLLGHFVLHRKILPLFVDPLKLNECNTRDREARRLLEREADEFAAELLMPEEVLRECMRGKRPARSSIFIQPVAAHFGVSELVFALRLCQLDLNPGSSIYSRQF